MTTFKFKTNINCGGCIKSITPYLEELKDIEWKVDTGDKRKVLEVKTEIHTEQEIINKVNEAGYEARPLRSGFLGGLFG
jgi:copper chaperone CopZ